MPANNPDPDPEALGECIQDSLKKFGNYDDAVTAVASWKAILSLTNYKEKLDFFDWFPRLPATEKPLTPEFTALFKNKYGIIGEVKAGFPQDDVAFDCELVQIKKYDEIKAIKGSDDKLHEIDKKDIILLLKESSGVDEITKRIFQKLKDEKHPFKLKQSNLIVMGYRYDEDRGKTFFAIKRNLYKDNGEFQEPGLKAHIVDNLKPLHMPPKLFKDHKTQHIVINDPPPLIFTLVFLWLDGFYRCLTREQLESLSEDNGFKVDLEMTPAEVAGVVNKGVFQKNIFKVDEIEGALDALKKIGLAKQEKDSRRYVITFKDLFRSGKRHKKEEDGDREKRTELAEFFAEKLCQGDGSTKKEKHTESEKQFLLDGIDEKKA